MAKKQTSKSKPTSKKKKRVEIKVKINLWRFLLIILGLIVFAPLILSLFDASFEEDKVDLTRALSDIREEKVESIEVTPERIELNYSEDEVKYAIKEPNISFAELLDRNGIDPELVNYSIADQSVSKAFTEVVALLLPIIIMAVIFIFIFRSQGRGAKDIFNFGKSNAKIFAKGKQNVSFKDVAGVDDAKKELEEVVDFLKRPAKYRKIGARTPKGVLLVGPAGVGKTLLAKAVAGEANVPFFSMAGSEFMEMLVGVGASRVRDLFAKAKQQAPSIIFIDEIDAIGRQRGRGVMGGHDEREQTLNQILVEMDGFNPNDNVAVVAATNRGDLLDPALLRPGRFDRRVTLDMPDKDGRQSILKIHAKGKKFKSGVNWDRVADRTVGFSGADLENMLNEAAIMSARDDKTEITMKYIEEAATKVKLGPAKRKLQTEEDKKITAYHEAGHAVVTHFLPKMDPVHRISIVARGMSLGHTLIPPAQDRTHETKTRLTDQIAAVLGGRAAEEYIFNEMTAGAASDIQHATKIARAMVMDFGMSSLGPIDFSENDPSNSTPWESADISETTKEKIDKEVAKIIEVGHKKALSLVKKHKKHLDEVSKDLLEKETLNRDEFEKIVGKKKNSV